MMARGKSFLWVFSDISQEREIRGVLSNESPSLEKRDSSLLWQLLRKASPHPSSAESTQRAGKPALQGQRLRSYHTALWNAARERASPDEMTGHHPQTQTSQPPCKNLHVKKMFYAGGQTKFLA